MKSVTTLNINDVLPLTKILKSSKAKSLGYATVRNEELLKYSARSFCQGIELSGTFLIAKKRWGSLPVELEYAERDAGYVRQFCNQAYIQTGMKIPKTQIGFRVVDETGFTVADLHLADLLFNHWLISDILLQDKHKSLPDNELDANYAGLGDGIFDEILESIERKAAEKGVQGVCLLAYKYAHRMIFEKRGYVVMPESLLPQLMRDLCVPGANGTPMIKFLK